MKRMLLVLACALALCAFTAGAQDQVVLKNRDGFYYDEYEAAVPAVQSEAFTVGYLVSRVAEQPDKGELIDQDVYAVQYDLSW